MGFIIGGTSTGPSQSYFIGSFDYSAIDDADTAKPDSSGNVYVIAYVYVSSASRPILIKYNSSGVIQWQRTLSNVRDNSYYDIAFDSSDNIYIVGGIGINQSNNIFNTSWIVKYDTSGTLQWQKYLAPANGMYSGFNGIAIDSSNNIYAFGYTDTQVNNGGRSALIVKYNSSGAVQWQKILGSDTNSRFTAGSITIDSANNLYITGHDPSSTYTSYSWIIAKYNSSGVIQWQRKLTGGTVQTGGITSDSSNNVYVLGSSNSSGSQDLIIAKYDSSGAIQWQRKLGNAGVTETAGKIVSSAQGNIYICGYNGSDGIIAKYNSSGAIQWQRTLGGTSSDVITGITLDSSENIYVAGHDDAVGTYKGTFAKLPGDGSLTGSYTVAGRTYTYAASSMTEQAASLTDAVASYTASTSTLTENISTLTDAAGAVTSTTTSIATVAGTVIPSGMTMGGTGTGMVISSYVAPPTIGQAMYGGYYAGSISATGNGVATHYLIIAPKSTGEASYVWSNSTGRSGIISDIDGYANTVSLAALSASNYPGFAWARSLTIGGFTDWYIPAKNELNTIFYNLCPVITPQTGGFSANANAVSPQPTSSWTTGSPSQTSAIAFRVDGSEAFSQNNPPYWMSTDAQNFFGDNAAWAMTGYAGGFNGTAKNNAGRFRAIRKVAI